MITWVHCWIEVVKIIASVGIERKRLVIMEGEMMMDIVEEGEGEKSGGVATEVAHVLRAQERRLAQPTQTER